MVGTLSVVAVVVEGGVWILGSTIVELVDMVGRCRGGWTRRARRRDAAAVRRRPRDGEAAVRPRSNRKARATETTMAELLDVLARRVEAGGRGIDDDDDDREFGLFQVVGYE